MTHTSNSKPIKSMGMVYFLAKFWATPVRKDWVKKKPETQKTVGGPLSIQSCQHIQVYARELVNYKNYNL